MLYLIDELTDMIKHLLNLIKQGTCTYGSYFCRTNLINSVLAMNQK